MTIHSEIELLEDTRQGLIDALIAKGQSVAQTDTMASYIPKIGNIPSGPQETGIQYLLKEIVEGTVEDINDSTLTILRSNCLQACRNLMSAKFTALLKIAAQAFYSCTKLYTLILDTDDMVFLENINAFQFTPIGMGTGNIYVPDALLATYRDDETWGHFYSQILPLSHYYSENCDIPLEYYSKQNVTELPTENIAKYCLYIMQTSYVDLVNKGQFIAGNTTCLETFTIQAGTTWNVKIDNTTGWYSTRETTQDPETGEEVPVSAPTELTLDWTFEQDTTINITQIYPLLNSYMFSESGENNIVVLSAQPGTTIADTDETMKFVAVTTENDWTGATHITLNKVEVDSQTSATDGWTNYTNAFDSNNSTYATCGTATDYLQVQYDLPVYIAGFRAAGQFVSGSTTSCNMSISTYDTDTEVLVATGTGAADTTTYTTSATFDDLYARTLRFKLTNSTAGTAPSTDLPTRISEVTLTVDPDSKLRVQNVSDGVNNVTTSYENRTGTWVVATQTVVSEDITVRDLPHENYYFNKTFGNGTYQALNYITTPTNVNINTGILANSNLKMIFDFIPRGVTGNVILGHFETGDSSDYRFFNASSRIYFDIGGGRINGSSCTNGAHYVLELGNYYVKNYGSTSNLLTGSRQNYSSNRTIKIQYAITFYNLKIFNGNILIGDFYPCTGGIYNTITKTFHGGSGITNGSSKQYNILV